MDQIFDICLVFVSRDYELWTKFRLIVVYLLRKNHRKRFPLLADTGSTDCKHWKSWPSVPYGANFFIFTDVIGTCALCRHVQSFVQSVIMALKRGQRSLRTVHSDRIQSFHMQALRLSLGIRWCDKVSNAVVNERTKLLDLPSLIADRRHSLFGHICRLPENTFASQALQLSIEATLALLPPLTGSVRRVVHEELGCNKWKTLACLLVAAPSWCCPDRKRRSFDVEDATTLSWSSAAVSEWVSVWVTWYVVITPPTLIHFDSIQLWLTNLTWCVS